MLNLDEEAKDVRVRAPLLGLKYRMWREENKISLKRASELSGLKIGVIQKFEKGMYVTEDEMSAYHRFFFRRIPNALKRYNLSVKTIFSQLVFYVDGEVALGAKVVDKIYEEENFDEVEYTKDNT